MREPLVPTATNVTVCLAALALALATTLLGRVDLDPWSLVMPSPTRR